MAPKSEEALDERFKALIWGDAVCRDALIRARRLALPQWRIVSGVLYGALWNHLTGKPSGHGLKDIDLIYFDPSDLSFEAEDREISRAATLFEGSPYPVELRNQARVHLWYEKRFGQPYEPLNCADDSLLRYASRNHAVAIRLEPDDRIDLYAPFGLHELFAMRVRPNRALDNKATHTKKGARAMHLWPEVTVEPW